MNSRCRCLHALLHGNTFRLTLSFVIRHSAGPFAERVDTAIEYAGVFVHFRSLAIKILFRVCCFYRINNCSRAASQIPARIPCARRADLQRSQIHRHRAVHTFTRGLFPKTANEFAEQLRVGSRSFFNRFLLDRACENFAVSLNGVVCVDTQLDGIFVGCRWFAA